jgi:hypothetical protein
MGEKRQKAHRADRFDLSDAELADRWVDLVERLRTNPGRATGAWERFGENLARAPERRSDP